MRVTVLAMCCSLATVASAGSPATVETVLRSSTTIADQPISLPQGPVEVTASIFTIEPGASLPIHRHPFPRYGYVLAGELTVSNSETGKSTTFREGEFIIESVAQWHRGANTGASPLKLLVIDQAPPGAKTTEVSTTQ